MNDLNYFRKNKIYFGKCEKKIVDYLFSCYQSPAPGHSSDDFILFSEILENIKSHKKNTILIALKSLVEKGVLEKVKKTYKSQLKKGWKTLQYSLPNH